MQNSDLPALQFKRNRIWAIQLTNSDHRIWDDAEEFTQLTFRWDNIPIDGRESMNNILIAISKYYSSYTPTSIKKIASGIYNFSRLKTGDGILGVTGNNSVLKVGFVGSEGLGNYNHSLTFNFNWIENIKPDIAYNNIFDPSLEIQKVTSGMLKRLNLPVALYEEKFFYDSYEFIPAGESDFLNLHLAEEPEAYQKDDKGGKISLFFGTNRNRTESSDVNFYFGNIRSDLSLGTIQVSIPRGHIQGELERPGSFLHWELKEKEGKHIVVKTIEVLEHSQFLTWLSSEVSNQSEKAGLIFIHGFNTTFAEAARRAAQIAWDIPFKGIAGFFSWPSTGKVASYLADIEKADASISDLSQFIQIIVQNSGLDKLHLIAHSMGNRILTVCINNLANLNTLGEKLQIINQIILGAPDIDQDVFKQTILPQFKTVGTGRTLYSSDKDQALIFSKRMRGGYPRLGECGSTLFVDNGLDTIDASNVPSHANNHGYIFETKELLTDLYFLLGKGLKPEERRLRIRDKNGLSYWLFPK